MVAPVADAMAAVVVAMSLDVMVTVPLRFVVVEVSVVDLKICARPL